MQVKVFNDNVHPYTEKFRGKEITIGAKQFIEMDEDEAEYFKGTFTFPVKNGEGLPDPAFLLSDFAHMIVKDEKAEAENREEVKKTNLELKKQNKRMEERLAEIEKMMSKRLVDGASL